MLMNNSATLEKIQQMKLHGMARAFKASLESRSHQKMEPDEWLAHLVENEWLDRENRKTQRNIRTARFRYQSSIDEIDFTANRNLDKNQLLRLADCTFIDRKENIILTGPTGVGKSFIASAFGYQACRMGHKVIYFNTIKLFNRLNMSKADNSFYREMDKIAKTDLLILDDFGLQPIQENNRMALLEIMEDRHGKRSTLIASQIPVDKWHDLFDDQTIADAILDRLVHTSHRIVLKGDSLRKKKSMVANELEKN
jgi:DNA replication protein DnaC